MAISQTGRIKWHPGAIDRRKNASWTNVYAACRWIFPNPKNLQYWFKQTKRPYRSAWRNHVGREWNYPKAPQNPDKPKAIASLSDLVKKDHSKYSEIYEYQKQNGDSIKELLSFLSDTGGNLVGIARFKTLVGNTLRITMCPRCPCLCYKLGKLHNI